MKIKDSEETNVLTSSETSENNTKIFGDQSQKTTCEFCNQKTWTLLKPQPTYLSYMLCLLVLIIFGFWISMILIPIILIVTQTLYHVCPLCSHELGTNNRIFNHFFLEDKVIGFKIAEVGFILTRKILLGILLSFIITGVLFLRIQSLSHGHPIGKLHFTYDSWEVYLQKCKPTLLVVNSAFCVENYLDHVVYNWEGYVIRLIDNRESLNRFLTHAVEILIKMEPSESSPDIYLTFDSQEANELGSVFNSLDRGRKVMFNGSIKSFGDDGKGRHLHGVGLIQREEIIDIEESGIGQGRYGAFRGKKTIGGH